jgi:triosephosphate isomerase
MSKPQIGVQDVSSSLGGAYTGEVSAAMTANLGAKFTIIGHSERRALGETNAIVNKKILAALSAGLEVVLCIGEQTRDHDGFYLGYLRDELDSAFQSVLPRDLPRIMIAYEPIYAIGRSAADAMSGQEVHEMVIFIRKYLAEKFNRSRADATTILYGGSVEGSNAESILKEGMVDGFLVGRASLDPNMFMEIIKFAKHT